MIVLLMLSLLLVTIVSDDLRARGRALFARKEVDRISGGRDLIPADERKRMNAGLSLIEQETGVAINISFVDLNKAESLEAHAAEEASRLGIGRKQGARGILIVYDRTSARTRVEVGYGLEAYFPDSFVARLIEDHTSTYFHSGDVSKGLRVLAIIMHRRVRDAMMGREFDATPLEIRARSRYVSGGAGASGSTQLHQEGERAFARTDGTLNIQISDDTSGYGPQPTAEQTFRKYLEWMQYSRNPNVRLFTEFSRDYFETYNLTPPMMDHLLSSAWGERYEVVYRGDHAMLYYTSTPFMSPSFFIRTPEGWQLDLRVELMRTVEYAGGAYTWGMRGDGMEPKLFADLWEYTPEGVIRIKGGDNRRFPVWNKRRS